MIDGITGPGSAASSPEKLEELIGSTSPFDCEVEFGPSKGFLSLIGWTRIAFGFSGSGTLVTDGVHVWISGRVANAGRLMTMLEENTQLACHQIANVESADGIGRFEYNVDDVHGTAVSLWLTDATAATRLVRVLPDAGHRPPGIILGRPLGKLTAIDKIVGQFRSTIEAGAR